MADTKYPTTKQIITMIRLGMDPNRFKYFTRQQAYREIEKAIKVRQLRREEEYVRQAERIRQMDAALDRLSHIHTSGT